MKKYLITAVLAAATLSSSVAGAQPGSGYHQNDGRGQNGCYQGERGNDCRARLQAEQRSHRQYVYRNGRYEPQDNSGAAITGGILGFMLGAAIAGSSSDRDYYNAHRNDHEWRNRCRSAYPGFDYRNGTYLGSDGYRHYCTR